MQFFRLLGIPVLAVFIIDDFLRGDIGEGISNAIRATLKRKSDFVIRYGGDEFLIILPDSDLENARVFASDIQKSIVELKIPNCDEALKASFGPVELLDVVK